MLSLRSLPLTLLLVVLLCSSALMAANTAPARPVNVQVTDTSTAAGASFRLTFGKSPDDHSGAADVVSYKTFLRRSGQSAVYQTPITATGAATYKRNFTGLTPGASYGIGVLAYDGSLHSTAVLIWKVPLYIPPPTNLTFSDPSGDNGTSLTIKFSRSPSDKVGGPVTKYAVYKRTSATGLTWAKTITATHAASYTATITGLTRGKSNGLAVRATDGVHVSTFLLGWATPHDTVAPAPPRSPVLSNPTGDTGTKMVLAFSKSVDDAVGKDVASYRLFRKTASTGFTLVGTVKATHAASYRYTFIGLTLGVRYCFAAAAYDGSNESTKVQVWGDSSLPRPVRNTTLVDLPGDLGTALRLTFDRSLDDGAGAADVTQYRIYRRTTATASTQIGTLTATGASSYTYKVAGLTKNVKYGITIFAWDGFQRSTPVLVWAVPKDNIPPTPPTGLTVADWPSDDGTALKITFQRSSNDAGTTPKTTSYALYRAGSSTTNGTRIATITATKATSYQYKSVGLVAGQTYWYRVVAVGPTGASAATSRVSGAPVDNRYVRPPLNLTAVDRPYDKGGIIDLAWAKSGDDAAGTKLVTTYYIYRKMANVQIDPSKIGQVTANGSAQYQWSDSKVPLELILYEYTVKAVASDGARSAAAGPAKAAAMDNNVLGFEPPSGLLVKDVAGGLGGQLQLSWRRSASEGEVGPPPPPPVGFNAAKVVDAGKYEFYRRTSTGVYTTTPTFSVAAAASATDPMTYTNSGLANGVRYYYKVRYRRYNQISLFTAEASAIPVKSSTASVEAATATEADTTPAAADTALGASLLSPPARLLAGQNALIGVSVSAKGRSAVCLEYAVGTSVARTAAAMGEGSYEVQMPLRISGLAAGTTVYVRAVVAGDGAIAASAISTIMIVTP